ncbi:MAG: amidohydrolase family protein [Nitrososphaerales archaeon]
MRTVIDAYTHNIPTTYLKEILKSSDPKIRKPAEHTAKRCDVHPNMVDFDVRISQMDKNGIAKQVTCMYQGLDPNHLPILDGADQVRLCKMINDDMATAVAKAKGRVFALGTPPLRGLENGGIEEMRRAIRELDLRGFMVVTNIGGEPVDHYKLFWQEANRLGVPVYLHPVDPVTPTSRPYEDEYDLMHVLGWPFETSLTMARLVLSGTMATNPNLRVVAHHLGAMIPFFAGRINESYDKEMSLARPDQKFDQVKGKGPAIEHFDGFYLDTAIGGNKAAIECACQVFGTKKIIFGTDYPFGPRDGTIRLERYPGIVEEADLSEEEKHLIFEENTSKLLKI